MEIPSFNLDQPINMVKRYRETGRFATGLCEDSNPARTELPDGYEYSVDDKITLREVGRLWGTPPRKYRKAHRMLDQAGISYQHVGIRSDSSRLVGFGMTTYRGEQAELWSLFVDPEHRSSGLGKAIIDERLRLAEAAGVESFYISKINPTNTLVNFYLERGFSFQSDGALGRGPAPAHISG